MSPSVVSTPQTSSGKGGASRQVKWGARMAFTYDQGKIPSEVGATIKQSASIRKQLSGASTPAEKENLLVAFPMFRHLQQQQPPRGGGGSKDPPAACPDNRSKEAAPGYRVATAGTGLSARPLAPAASKPSPSILKKSSYRQRDWVVPARQKLGGPDDRIRMPYVRKSPGLRVGEDDVFPNCPLSPTNECFYDSVDDTCGWWA